MNNISSQILLALPLPLESHLANITLSGNIITVETIPVFLARIPKKELGREYIIYSPAGEYEIDIWEDKLNTGLVTIQKYEFQNGFTNFVPIVNFILPDNVVIDENYIHTDNNLTDKLIEDINNKVSFVEQTLTSEQQLQARNNISSLKKGTLNIASREDLDRIDLEEGIYNIDNFDTGILIVSESIVENSVTQIFLSSYTNLRRTISKSEPIVYPEWINKDYEQDEELTTKQETLFSGINIKTINGESVLGEGDITIESGIEEAPIDGNQYARQNGNWAQITIPESGIQSISSTDDHIVVDNTDLANPVLSFQLVDNENLLTDDELAKLAAIEEGAEVNIIEVVKVNNTPLTVTEKEVNIDLSGYSLTSHNHLGETINPDSILLDHEFTDEQIALFEKGQLYWDEASRTLSFKVADGGTIQIGQEPHDYYINLSGGDLVNGDIVSSIGATGNRTAITKTDVTNDSLALSVIGMVTVTTIGNNNVGRITKNNGKVKGLNTNAYNEGDTLYVDPANAGKWTATRPSAPMRAVRIGTVTVKHATEGVVELQIATNPKIEELSNVDGNSISFADDEYLLKKGNDGVYKTVLKNNLGFSSIIFRTWEN